MDQDFAEAIRLMAEKEGKEKLVNGEAKKFLSDYCRNQFNKEKDIFLRILNANCGEHINSADNVLERKRKLMEQLEEDTGLAQKVTAEYLDLLGLILKGDASKCGEAVILVQTQQPVSQPAPQLVQTRQSAPQPAPQPVQNRQAAPLASSTPNIVPEGFVWIPGGTFMMGSPNTEPGCNDNERPQHQVTLSGFYMGKYQVTQEQYQTVMGNNPSKFTSAVTGESGTPGKLPVERVSWYEAIVFCNKLSIKEGLKPVYSKSNRTNPEAWGAVPTSSEDWLWGEIEIVSGSTGYRLPTEAQWEYACRAGTTTAYNTVDKFSDSTGWYSSNSGGKTHQVGLKPPNAWGLYDIHGNVMEWCWDWYGSYPSGDQTDPTGAVRGDNRVPRGGFWGSDSQYLRSAYRNYYRPYYKDGGIGFRLVRS